jgi:hypothetical protein
MLLPLAFCLTQESVDTRVATLGVNLTLYRVISKSEAKFPVGGGSPWIIDEIPKK